MRWTLDQLIIALEFYFVCPERMHTDAHPKCKEVAGMIGRSAGALDKIIRNIKSVDTGHVGLVHASSLIYQLVAKYKNNQPLLIADATAVRAKNKWMALDCGS